VVRYPDPENIGAELRTAFSFPDGQTVIFKIYQQLNKTGL